MARAAATAAVAVAMAAVVVVMVYGDVDADGSGGGSSGGGDDDGGGGGSGGSDEGGGGGTCSAKRRMRSACDRAVRDRGRRGLRRGLESGAPCLWGFPHHQSPHAGWYPTRRVGYLYSASSPGGLGRFSCAAMCRHMSCSSITCALPRDGGREGPGGSS